MLEWGAALNTLGAIAILAVVGWLLGVIKRDVSIVDSLWSLFFLLGAIVYAVSADASGPRVMLLFSLVTLWALRLSVYLTWRNWGESEDRRYQAIRARNEPGFTWKSLYLVFGLQGVLAFIIALPILTGLGDAAPLGLLDYAGAVVWGIGFIFEAVADGQLARFKADRSKRGKVLDTGLWRYTRHPNYFGEAMLWWGFYLIAIGADGWWTLFAPLLMTFLLLKVSGVTLLEADIQERRPDYRAYIARTNAFVPWPPKAAQ
jgi:steroid 5-alpha reductase family enzyme